MKRIFSLILAIVMLASAFPAAHAAIWTGCQNCENPLTLCPDCNLDTYCPDCDICESCGYETPDNNTNDHTAGTLVVFEADSSESYTITVPAKLAPGQTGTVTLAGTWANNRVVTVTADENVTLSNSILESDTKTLKVTFDGISETGDNTKTLSFTEDVAVANISNALFGTWSGKFNYNVSVADYAPGNPDPDTGDGEEANLITFTINGTEYQAEEGITWREWIETENNVLGIRLSDNGKWLVWGDVGGGAIVKYGAVPDGATDVLSDDVIDTNGTYSFAVD